MPTRLLSSTVDFVVCFDVLTFRSRRSQRSTQTSEKRQDHTCENQQQADRANCWRGRRAKYREDNPQAGFIWHPQHVCLNKTIRIVALARRVIGCLLSFRKWQSSQVGE